MPPKAPKPPPEFETEGLKEHPVVKKWMDKGFPEMDLLKLSETFLTICAPRSAPRTDTAFPSHTFFATTLAIARTSRADRKDKVKKDKAAAKNAKKLKLPEPVPEPEAKNPGVDLACFEQLLGKMKITLTDKKGTFKGAIPRGSETINFSEFVHVVAQTKA